MTTISLRDMLAAKERRSAVRADMQAAHPGVCVSLSLNIPGAEKLTARTRALFRHACDCVTEVFEIRTMHAAVEATGPWALCAVAEEPGAAKAKAAAIEEATEYGRLLDIDVYDAFGEPVSRGERENGRACFLCERPAAVCMREGSHSTAELARAVDAMFVTFYAEMSRCVSPAAAFCASLGIEALLFEAAAHPSPGLVDPFHSGSHKDMDFFTFQASTAALAHALARCAEAGIRHDSHPATLLPVLRRIGLEAERDMLRATQGVNTQKGALFSMGLVLGASGLLIKEGAALKADAVAATLQRMTAGITARELGKEKAGTAGEEAYRRYGISGIRGEVERGLPCVLRFGLPALEKALAGGKDRNRALIVTLISLMAEVDDTTIIHRAGSAEALAAVRRKAALLLGSGALDTDGWQEAVRQLDAELVRDNISPGGSADLLAITWYLHRAATPSAAFQREFDLRSFKLEPLTKII